MPAAGTTYVRGRACEICASATVPRQLRGGGTLESCPACGHVRRPLLSAPAAHRDLAYGGDPALDSARIALTFRALRPKAVSSVFEIGYGAGALLRRFHDAGARVGGVDPGQLDVDVDPVVREHGALWSGPAEDLPDGWFDADLVVGVHVLEHVDDVAATLAKATTMLRPGGRAVFLTPAGDSWGLTAYGSSWWMLEDPTHIRFFSADSLARAASGAGLTGATVDRLVMDSVTTDAASLARMRGQHRADGVLADKRVLAAAVASAPVILATRAVARRTRPTLRLTAYRAD